MAGPWEQYQTQQPQPAQTPPPSAGPWEQYAASSQPAAQPRQAAQTRPQAQAPRQAPAPAQSGPGDYYSPDIEQQMLAAGLPAEEARRFATDPNYMGED